MRCTNRHIFFCFSFFVETKFCVPFFFDLRNFEFFFPRDFIFLCLLAFFFSLLFSVFFTSPKFFVFSVFFFSLFLLFTTEKNKVIKKWAG